MKKYFVVADVHGFYSEMLRALVKAGYNPMDPNHIFVSLGDLLDRGPNPKECLDFVNAIPKEKKILIRDNHEDLLEEAIWRKGFFWNDYPNGTANTVRDLYQLEHNITDEEVKTVSAFDMLVWLKDYEPYKQYIDSTQYYAIRGDNIFLHGWVPYWIDAVEQFEHISPQDWKECAWINGMQSYHFGGPIYKDLDKKEIYTIFCGHYHTSWWRRHITQEISHSIPPDEEWEKMTIDERKNYFRPVVEPGIVALDACTAFSGVVNCYVVEA